MKKRLRLFVWNNDQVLVDYSSGVAFALAENEVQARNLLIGGRPSIADDPGFKLPPKVFNKPFGYSMSGSA